MANPPAALSSVEPLEAWDSPAVPEFSPDIRIYLVHDAYTAWARRSCAGAVIDNLKKTMESLDAAPLWVGPDSLAPRPLDADLREGPPPAPDEWVKYLRARGVVWMALGKADVELGREFLTKLARDTGMKFLTDVWEGEPFLPCITETHAGQTVAACVLSESAQNPADAWKRTRERISSADWKILFASGSPAWQKRLENLPDAPDVIIACGMQVLPHGQTGPHGQIRVAAGGELQNVGELGLRLLSPKAAERHDGASSERPRLLTEAENIREERARLENDFQNLARILGDSQTDSTRRERYSRRMAALRGEWVRLRDRARDFSRPESIATLRQVSFCTHAVGSCARP